MKGICRLCQNDDDLQESHIIPRFVFSWLKETSPTPFLRGSRTPNKRVQNGEKRFWLCAKCEQLIGDYERQFSMAVFCPIAEDGLHQISYGEWLLKFCVSVSWRNLLREREEHPQHRQLVDEALKVWREFLLGKRPHPGRFEQHFIPFGTIHAAAEDRDHLPANLNRYVLRYVEMCIVHPGGFSYMKMGPVAVLGFFDFQKSEQWPSSKVHVNHGAIGQEKVRLPPLLWRFLEERARNYGSIHDGLSDRQRANTEIATARSLERDKDSLSKSHWLKTLQQDVDLFGERAFKEGWPRDPKRSK
jgi:hypothetical protein